MKKLISSLDTDTPEYYLYKDIIQMLLNFRVDPDYDIHARHYAIDIMKLVDKFYEKYNDNADVCLSMPEIKNKKMKKEIYEYYYDVTGDEDYFEFPAEAKEVEKEIHFSAWCNKRMINVSSAQRRSFMVQVVDKKELHDYEI